MLHTRHGSSVGPRTESPSFEEVEPRRLMSATLSGSTWSLNQPAAITAPDASNTSDFDDDGDNDLVFRAAAFGRNGILRLEEDAAAGTANLPQLRDPNWELAGVADFDGDSDPDLLFRNSSTKKLIIWQMDGTARVGTTTLPAAGSFELAGVADFTTDGTADVALINPATGRLVIWELDNGVIAPNGVFNVDQRIGNRDWQASGAGDFDADGDADLLFRNTRTGQNVIWEMNDTSFVGSSLAPRLAGAQWQVGEVKDFDGDGDADIAWRNNSTAQNAIWLLDGDGTVLESSTLVAGFANAQYAMAYSQPPEFTPASASDDGAADRTDALLAVEPLVTFAAV